MNIRELQALNVCQSLDDLMNLDPKGYGVSKILYSAARKHCAKPLCLNAAEKLHKTIKKDDIVYILTGFVLLPHHRAETDGIISSVFLARALVKAFKAKPLIICPHDCIEALKKLSPVAGLHCYESVKELKQFPKSMAVLPFTKNIDEAESCAENIINTAKPKAVISIECPGANKKSVYHNAAGLDVTKLQAKTDVLFQKLLDSKVLNIAIGDLGNEIGMVSLENDLKAFVPYMKEGEKASCSCPCKGGIMAKTKADNIISASVSDWGCYALIAALALLSGDIEVFHTAKAEKRAIYTASEAGMVDMDGWLVPQIDGMSLEMNVEIVKLMYLTVKHALDKGESYNTWFKKVLELGFFD